MDSEEICAYAYMYTYIQKKRERESEYDKVNGAKYKQLVRLGQKFTGVH